MAKISLASLSPPYGDVLMIDQVLENHNMRRHSVPGDGNNFYHAVAHQLRLLGKSDSHTHVRRKCNIYLRKNSKFDDVNWIDVIGTGETKIEFMERHMIDGEFADDVILQAAASAFSCVINVVTFDQVLQVLPRSQVYSNDELWLGRISETHYVSIERGKGSNADLPEVTQLFDLKSLRNSDPYEAKHSDDEYGPTNAYHRPSGKGNSRPKSPRGSTGPKHVYHSEKLDSERKKKKMDKELPNDDFFLEDDGYEEDEIPEYDKFVCEPPEDESRTSSTTLKFFTKTFKLFSFFIFGASVFLGGVTSKGSLLVLMNAAKPYTGDKINMKQDIGVDAHQYDVTRAWAYMLLLFMALFPEVLTMGYSLYRIIMKYESPLELSTLLWGGLWEVIHSIGEGILIFKVLPYMDATIALLMIPVIGYVAIIFNIYAKVESLSSNKNKSHSVSRHQARVRDLVLSIIALLMQSALLIFCFANFFSEDGIFYSTFGRNYTYIWAFFGFLLTSFRYWENFITSSIYITKSFKIEALKLRKKLDLSRFHASFLFSLVKCLILTAMAFLVLVVLEQDTYAVDNRVAKSYTYSDIIGLLSTQSRTTQKIVNPIIGKLGLVLVTQTLCSFATYFFGRVSCLTLIQKWSYTFPVVLITPFITGICGALAAQGTNLIVFMGMSGYTKAERYFLNWNILLDLSSVSMGPAATMAVICIIGLVLGWLSTVFITLFLWSPSQNRLERTEVLFCKANYCGPFVDQILMLNRRQFEQVYTKSKQKKMVEEEKKQSEKQRNNSSHSRATSRRKSRRLTVSNNKKLIPNLYLCATMWHETDQEMTMLLTSMMRLDKDQGQRRANAQKDPDYYNFEIHLMFDDAMEHTAGKEVKTNRFVHSLCELIPLAANKVDLGKGYDMSPPVIYPTPYGGRLEFVLPHGNLLIVHLKDKDKIRHRKRWSQCMYMYYILGYLQASKKSIKLENLFLLALDGDVDFQPSAVLLLLDRMKRNPDVGAACGRIHPTGSGPVVWFQKFEYAVGHWLQKTAEHVLGCVLCSPGCFSMFRGLALVDVNVMNQYTKPASKALHYVQWDQGEDRWLCTLLLKQGWRIEYSAASDSFTFAPEDFKEFYNQRRRWGPSTMANIFDILLDAKLTVKNNMYISWGYIAYQVGLMASSILGPATVVMIVQGAFQYIFSWDAGLALFVSLLPVVIFIILCYTTSADIQVAVAGILTILYSLVMMGVIVGVVASMVNTVILDPNSLFMILLVGLYAFTGIVHPQEMMCLIHGILYYLCVPSAFILLMVYSLTNMNNVSWGTREVKTPQVAAEQENKEQVLEQVANKGKSVQLAPTSIYDAPKTDGYYSCGLGNLCQCALCIQPAPVYIPIPTEPKTTQPRRHTIKHRPTMSKQSVYNQYSQAKAKQVTGVEPETIEKRLSKRMSLSQFRRMSTKLGKENMSTSQLRRLSTHHRKISKKLSQTGPGSSVYGEGGEMSHDAAILSNELLDRRSEEIFSSEDEDEDQIEMDRIQDEDEEMLYWLIEGPLEDGTIEYLDNEERSFWKYLIDKYLYPLNENKEEKARISADLIELRNQMNGAYFLANALWLVLNFALQLAITDIAIVFYIDGSLVTVNPVSFAFLIFFLVILLIQFTCMLAHRWSTALHLLSVTSLQWNDSREGFTNVSTNAIEKAEKANQRKKKKKAESNGGNAFMDDDGMLSKAMPTESNVTYGEEIGSGGQLNPTYDKVGDDSSSSSSEDENPYETVQPKLGNTNRLLSGNINKYGALDSDRIPKRSVALNMEMFGSNAQDDHPGKSKAYKQSVFNNAAVDDLIERRTAAQVHKNENDKKTPSTSVRFDDEGNTSF